MWMSRLTLLNRSIHSLVDSGKVVSTEEVRRWIEDGVIIEELDRLADPKVLQVGGLTGFGDHPEDKVELVDALQRLENCVVVEDMGLANGDSSNGLLFLLALLNELIQANVRTVELQ